MFGYIVINKAEMKFKDYDVYHSYYCGLCKQLKARYGRRGQMTLSYDMTFLILLLDGLYEPDTQKIQARCGAHPLQKHSVHKNEFTDYAAAMNLVLSYYKCKDDWLDERKAKSRLTAGLLHSCALKVNRDYPQKVSFISSRLSRIRALELEEESSLDTMAGLFGEIMGEIFVYRDDEWAKSLRRFGFFLGKFIYIMDAYEDIEKDLKNGSYNPLKNVFKQDNFEDYCRQILTMMIAECSREFEKLPILTHAEILRNILYSGVWCRFETVTKKRTAHSKPTLQTGEKL